MGMGGGVRMIIRDMFMGAIVETAHRPSLLGDGMEAIPLRRSTMFGAANHRGCSDATA